MQLCWEWYYTAPTYYLQSLCSTQYLLSLINFHHILSAISEGYLCWNVTSLTLSPTLPSHTLHLLLYLTLTFSSLIYTDRATPNDTVSTHWLTLIRVHPIVHLQATVIFTLLGYDLSYRQSDSPWCTTSLIAMEALRLTTANTITNTSKVNATHESQCSQLKSNRIFVLVV